MSAHNPRIGKKDKLKQRDTAELMKTRLEEVSRENRANDMKKHKDLEKGERLALHQMEKLRFENSEEERRKRAYMWYNRIGGLPRDKLIAKVGALPASAGISKADVDLLPWNYNSSRVNVVQMNAHLISRRN